MRKMLIGLTVASFALFGSMSALAADCVEVDVEVPSQLVIGEFFTLSSELINCGDQATLTTFEFSLSYNGEEVTLPPIQAHRPLAAGQVVSHELELPVPPIIPTGDYEICVTAISGDASSTDCAAFSVVDDGGSLKIVSGSNADCLELDVEVPSQLIIGEMFTLSTELINCGDEASLIDFAFSLTYNGEEVPLPPAQPRHRLAAGEVAAHELQLPVPPAVPTGDYELCVTASYGDASVTDCAAFEVSNDGGTPRIDSPNLPTDYVLLKQNTPNPFNPTTDISFVLKDAGNVSLKVYDVTGRTVKTLVDGERNAGVHTVTWDGTDATGASAASGIYFYRIEFDGYTEARKMVLMK